MLTLISQFSKLLAFFLPLKIIILLGSTGIPGYFPDSWSSYDRDVLVVGLSAATVLIYVSHLVSEKLLTLTVSRGAAVVVEHSSKLVLFANQDALASQAYQKLTAALATLVLSVLLAAVFGVLYPFFLFVMIAYVVVVAFGVSIATQANAESRLKLQERSGSLIALLSGAGFLVLFAFMVADFLLWEGVGFMVAIISILLSRQLFSRIEGAIKDALWLHGKKLQINAIVFTGHRFEKAPEPAQHRKLWSLLNLRETPERLVPLIESISESGVASVDNISCRWRQSGLVDVLTFDVSLTQRDGSENLYLLKVLGNRNKKAALNEADLLASSTGRALPSLKLEAVGQLDGFDAHLFRFSSDKANIYRNSSRLLPDRLVGCWQVEPDRNLVARYERSHPYLYQRISVNMMSRLELVADGSQEEDINKMSERFEEICRELSRLPLVVINLGVPVDLSFVAESGELKLAHWGNWSLEPIGADLPVGERWEKELAQLLEAAAAKRDALKELAVWQVQLCSFCNAFESAFNQQKYSYAIALIPRILQCLPSLSSVALDDESMNADDGRVASQ
ncbi:DUF3488 domain-containing protein [Halomonas mongoliensis]|uniref:DUF3488 domain-containing protein n=1 Tax=Halomonas mongoliensis TaxID=321265 RepID=UPI00403AB615